jgi:DNA-binding NarL/FixJ family response regulator
MPTVGELSAILRAGVRGFLLSEAAGDEIAVALRAVSQGLLVLDPLIARTLTIAPPSIGLDELTQDEPLTERELEVLQLLALGLPNKTIATRLRISEHTVKFHVGSILAKLDASSRTEAVTRAARRGLLAL